MRPHERDINQDVRELGTLLGRIIESQTSTEAFETVEGLRTESIDYRRGDAASRDAIVERISALPRDRMETVARAFTAYFELINLAEERERVRAIRAGIDDGGLDDGIEACVARLGDADVDEEEVASILEDVLVQPTFTAHPTEARRKTVKANLREIESIIRELDERHLTNREHRSLGGELEAQILSLWQTAQIRPRRPEPLDEARNVRWYLENTLMDVVPDVYDTLEANLEEEYGDEIAVPQVFDFRSWAGSDRDGNPYVTPETTDATLARQRRAAIAAHRERLKELSGVLSQAANRVEVDETVERRLREHRRRLPEVGETAADRYPEDPYRQLLYLMRERLARIGDVRPGEYEDAEAFHDDLVCVAESLRSNAAESIADAYVDQIARRVETFGFVLAGLDVRDHRQHHTDAVAETLQAAGIEYGAMDESERQAVLTEAIVQAEDVVDVDARDGLSQTTRRVLERFARLADWQAEYGADAVDTYCISMTERPSHVLEVLFLADQGGIVSHPDHSGLDVVPLLETRHALANAEEILGTLFENEAYARALAGSGDVQEVMLGYSDSNKENGFLAANWSLYDAQRGLSRIADEHDRTLRLFHGRGGSISRGGGPMNEAIRALPIETATGEIKFTEQGEAIAEKYGNPAVAERNLEQMLDAQVRARLESVTGERGSPDPEWTAAMEVMADGARDAYRSLIETEGFVDYFRSTTPIDVIEDLNMGSRPASRSGTTDIEDLRAIPWVFAWTQSRCILTGWYSVGAGIDAFLEGGGELELLQEMYDEWAFFRTVIDNAALALARADMEIAASYAALADAEERERIFPQILSEYDRSADAVCEITGRDELLRRDWLAESLALRNPYVDPLNLLQVRLLDADDRSAVDDRTLRLTVKGIAAGMKNTG